jgi:sugar/nucleoside kinase (ribokinase family)
VVRVTSVNAPLEAIIGADKAACFAAGMLYGQHESWPLDDCIILGHAAAAVAALDK